MSTRVIQKLFSAFEKRLETIPQPLKNRKAIHAITHCRTSVMGTSYYSCPSGHQPIEQHHSCRHRSCYLCAQQKRLEWIDQQKKRLLNTPHFHVIFTLPHEYLSLWRYNEALFTRLIFKASQQTLLELLADKKHGGFTPGILMALHTWGRQLTLHPHTHCLVTAGGLDAQANWKAVDKFLLPSAVIRSVYRGKVQAFIRAAYDSGELKLPPDLSISAFWAMYRSLYKKSWSVRIEERYEHGKGVLLYLARYCKGGPLNPQQITGLSHNRITMTYLDHRDKRTKRQTLSPVDFIRRLLQHVPVSGLHTIRYYGLYAPAAKQRYQQSVSQHGTLSGVSSGAGLDVKAMLLYCKTCGCPARLTHRRWSKPIKGNSINKDVLQDRARGHAQQVVEVDLAKGRADDTS